MDNNQDKQVPLYIMYSRTSRVLRFLELIFCACSLAAAIYFSIKVMTIASLIITAISFGFLVIVALDFIAGFVLKQYTLPIWCPLAFLAALMFFLSFGLMFWRNTLLFILFGVLFLVTGIIFLIEGILLLWKITKVYYPVKIYPDSLSIVRHGRLCDVSMMCINACAQTMVDASNQHPSRGRVQELKTHSKSRMHEVPKTTSYGGTFPVQKDGAPLPSPEPISSRSQVPNQKSSSHHRSNSPSRNPDMHVCPAMALRKSQSGLMRSPPPSPTRQQFSHPSDELTRSRSSTGRNTSNSKIPRSDSTNRIDRWYPGLEEPNKNENKELTYLKAAPKDEKSQNVQTIVYKEQAPPFVEYHYIQTPCGCGFTHYQTKTTVEGAVKNEPSTGIHDHLDDINRKLEEHNRSIPFHQQDPNIYVYTAPQLPGTVDHFNNNAHVEIHNQKTTPTNNVITDYPNDNSDRIVSKSARYTVEKKEPTKRKAKSAEVVVSENLSQESYCICCRMVAEKEKTCSCTSSEDECLPKEEQMIFMEQRENKGSLEKKTDNPNRRSSRYDKVKKHKLIYSSKRTRMPKCDSSSLSLKPYHPKTHKPHNFVYIISSYFLVFIFIYICRDVKIIVI